MSRTSRALSLSFTLAVLALANARAATDESAPTHDASRTEKLQEVTVTAQRAKLAKRVQKFVNQIVVPENNGADGIARWQLPPACPLVSGLTRQQGEFILERLSELARKAGVPLAGEQCRPNLYILVTTQPQELLKGMEKRNRPFTFGYDSFGNSGLNITETPAGVVKEFIETPRAVRVWYNDNVRDPWGQKLASCQANLLLPICNTPVRDLSLREVGMQQRFCSQTQYYQCSRGTAGGSNLTLSAMTTFSRVFVIVDQTRLHGVTFGQLADYVAMVGFAKLKPGARLGDAPTILKLFDEAPHAAPGGMTDWDQAFLKSLYATEQLAKGQSGQIVRAMVRDIVH